MPDWSVLLSGDGVLEGPTWDEVQGLFYTNVTAGGVHHLDLATLRSACMVEHRKGIGGLALDERGDFVISGRNVAIKRRGGGPTELLFSGEGLGHEVIGFNDIAVTPDRTVAVGALGPGSLSPHTVEERAPPPDGQGTGRFYEVSRAGHRLLADDIGHPNGIAFSPDGRFAYASDSLRRCVYRFRVTDAGWSQRTILAQFEDGLPDGMATASDGTIWLALALAARVVVLSPDGALLRSYRTPYMLTTSVRFGGPGLRDIFVTTGSHGAPGGAAILGFRSPITGCPARRAAL